MSNAKIVIIIFVAILILGFAVAELDTYDLDNICNTNNSYLYKKLGSWGCRANIYGEMYNYTDGGYQVGIADFSKYYNITRLACGESNGITCTTGTAKSQLEILTNGTYEITGTISLLAGTGGEYGLGIAKNYANLETQQECYIRFEGLAKVNARTMNCYMELNNGDTLSFMIDDENNPAQDVTIQTVSMTIKRIGD